MGNNLDLDSGSHLILASLYSDEDWAVKSLTECECAPVSDAKLREIGVQAIAALERGLRTRVDRRDWTMLLRVGEAIQSVLPHDVYHDLATLADRAAAARETEDSDGFDVSMTLRLRGSMADVPWELMHVGNGRLLAEVFDVGRQITAPTDFRVASAKRVLKDPIRFLIAADPASKGSMDEARRLAGHLKAYQSVIEVVFREDTTKTDLLSDLPRADILHYAGDAEPGADSPENRGWKIGKGERLGVEDIANAKHDRWPVLVFANTCNAGQMLRSDGEATYDGMAYALLRRGVRHFISALARIPDSDAVGDFAQAFYKALIERDTVGTALRKARGRISTNPDGSMNVLQRIIAANYIHYGNPCECPFRTPPSGMHENPALRNMADAMRADRAGRVHEAREYLTTLRAAAESGAVASHIDSLLTALEVEAAQRSRLRARLKRSSGHISAQGSKIGPYELADEIGHGTYRTVYRARSFDEHTPDLDVALALPYDQRTEVAQRECRAFKELSAKVQHPGLVRIYDVSLHDGILAVAYEHFDGRPLSDLMAQRPGPWPAKEACGIIRQAAEALEAAHKRGVVHGKLTPRDILIDANGTVKLLDVGRYQTLRRAGYKSVASCDDKSYCAPEHWTGGASPDNPLWDTWSLSVIAYQLLTGHHPFEHSLKCDAREPDWRNAIVGSQPEPVESYVSGIPSGLSSALRDCLSVGDKSGPRTLAALLGAI